MASITKKSEGKYLIRASKGTGTNRRYENQTFRGTLKEARAQARKLDTMIDSGETVKGKYTFDQFAKLWLDTIRRTVKPLTYDNYEGHIRRHTATIADLKIADVSSTHIQEIYNTLSPSTVAHLHATLRPLFKSASRKRLIRENPCEDTVRPTNRRKREIPVFTNEELRRFVSICQEVDGGTVAEFAVETGMRPEEYLALRWSDIVDGDVIVLQVVQYYRKGGGYYFETPKTAAGRRRIPLSEAMLARLHRHRIEQQKHRLALRVTWNSLDLVFPNAVGNPQSITNLSHRVFARVFERFGFRQRLTPKDLRHICATTLLMNGTNIKIVSERLGHASIKITLDTYSHVIPTMQTEAVSVMDKAMRG